MFTKFSKDGKAKTLEGFCGLDLGIESNPWIGADLADKLLRPAFLDSSNWDKLQQKYHSDNHNSKEKLENDNNYPDKSVPKSGNIAKKTYKLDSASAIPCSWPECNKSFSHLENLKKHLKIHTEGNLLECSNCNKQFLQTNHLKLHLRTHTGGKRFSCCICPKSFFHPSTLEVHMRIHSGEKPYSCTICPKFFTQLSNLQIHMRIHRGEKPYSCTICPKSFTQLSNLQVHMRIHSGEKPYSCTICPKSFTQLSNLQVHMRIHTEEKPYNCKICSESFAQQMSFQYHMRTHAGEKPFKCPFCSKSSSTKSNMNKHIKAKHRGKKSCEPKHYHEKSMKKEDLQVIDENLFSQEGSSNFKTKQGGQTERFFLTCQHCQILCPSLIFLCEHYSTQHNLPQVVMKRWFVL